jgi:hypothetical protein
MEPEGMSTFLPAMLKTCRTFNSRSHFSTNGLPKRISKRYEIVNHLPLKTLVTTMATPPGHMCPGVRVAQAEFGPLSSQPKLLAPAFRLVNEQGPGISKPEPIKYVHGLLPQQRFWAGWAQGELLVLVQAYCATWLCQVLDCLVLGKSTEQLTSKQTESMQCSFSEPCCGRCMHALPCRTDVSMVPEYSCH